MYNTPNLFSVAKSARRMPETEKHSPEHPPSPLTEGRTKDDGRLWPKLKKGIDVVTHQSTQNSGACLDRGCRKVTTRSSTKRQAHYSPASPHNTPQEVPTFRPSAKPGWANRYSMRTLRQRQLDDPDIAPVIKWVEDDHRPVGATICAASPVTRHYWNCWPLLELQDGVLFRKFLKRDGTGSYRQFIVPRVMQRELFYKSHNSLFGGHLGRNKNREKMLRSFYWHHLREDVSYWVALCSNCAANKTPPKMPKAPLGDMRVGAPMDPLATDILGPFPTTPRGSRYVLVVTDYFSNWVEIFAVPDQTAGTCAEKILNEVIGRFGCPLDLHSDQGPNYRSAIFQELCRLLEIRKTQTAPRNPKCNGKVERFNKTLVPMIQAYLKGQQREWDRHLGCLAAAYQATPHEATGLTPNLLMLGREVQLPMEVVFGSGTPEGNITSYGEYVDQLREQMHHAHDVARKHLEVTAVRQKERYDGKANPFDYAPGDYVWLANEKRTIGECPKLNYPFEGPFLVVGKLSNLDYAIQSRPSQPPRIVNHNKLKPYEGVTRFRWAKSALEQASKKFRQHVKQDGCNGRSAPFVVDEMEAQHGRDIGNY